MATQDMIPDQIHINMIRERLWCDREFGRAAVMVGAGFSRNAEKVSPAVPDFPLWIDLAQTMFDRLYQRGDPNIRNRSERRLTETAGLNAVRLASQYRAAFGEHELDSVIRKSFPDQQHRPGWLHQCLLELPWSDVFTTNYDTLLERTLPFVHDRKYDIVLDHLDIPHAMRPRIVKLHGSLDSKRPLIIDEEHYRTYPQRFAPFVNMVQQSIMENLLCLIGFSGEDPNFLYWSGWVRDNLGGYAPPIYLVSLRKFSSAEDRLLHDRNVIPIDLSPVVSQATVPPANRHRLALSWFVENLLKGAPSNPMRWPDITKPRPCVSAEVLAGLPSPPEPPGYREPRARDVWPLGPVEKSKILLTIETWKLERKEYPNWIVCPRQNRDRIWQDTEHKIPGIVRNIDQFNTQEQIDVFYELTWRLETGLLPFFDVDATLEQLVRKVNPYPNCVHIDGEVLSPETDDSDGIDWDVIGPRWMHLVFAVARAAREAFDLAKFRSYMDIIETVTAQSITWKARWYYEDCLFHLYRLDDRAARRRVLEWPDTTELPFWEHKRASVLAELGDLREAERIAEAALDDTRKKQNIAPGDMFLRSIEGWLMLLLNAIKSNKWLTYRQFTENYRDRWEKLSSYQCNPWVELEWMDMALSVELPEARMAKEVKRGFDPGNRIITYNAVLSTDTDLWRPAYGLLRMLEEGGVPMAVGMMRTVSKAITKPAIVSSYFSVPRSISIMIRCQTEGDLGEWLDRSRVARLAGLELDNTATMLLQSFDQELLNLTNATTQKIRVAIEAISRVCVRFSDEDLNRAFDLAIRFYDHPVTRANPWLDKSVTTLFERLLFTMSEASVLDKLPVLLSLPLPNERDPGFTDPISCLSRVGERLWTDQLDRSSWDVPVADLLAKVSHGAAEIRVRAVARLCVLHEMNSLKPQESEEFGIALWSQIGQETNLPANTGLHDFQFLMLPEPTPGTAKKELRKRILEGDFLAVNLSETGGLSVGFGAADEFQANLRGSSVTVLSSDETEKEALIDWTQEEAIEILGKALSWWDREKDALKSEKSTGWDIIDTVRGRLSPLVWILRDVVLPRLGEAPLNVKETAVKLLNELDEFDFCILSALPMVLFADPSYEDHIGGRIRRGLNSRFPEEVSQAVVGILHWAVHSVDGRVSPPSTQIWTDFGCKLVSRHQPALDTAISAATFVVRQFPRLLDGGKLRLDNMMDMLDFLFVDTEYPDSPNEIAKETEWRSVAVEEIPEYRRLGTELAYGLFEHLRRVKGDIPDVLRQWESRAQSDPLPEVKRAWPSVD